MIPGPGRSYMPGLKPALSNKRHHHNEKPSRCNQRKPVSSNRDPVWSKHKYINNKVNFKVFEPLVPSAWTACRQNDAMHSYAAAPGTRGWANPGPAPRNRGWRGVGKLQPCPLGPLGTGGGEGWANSGPAPRGPSEQGVVGALPPRLLNVQQALCP